VRDSNSSPAGRVPHLSERPGFQGSRFLKVGGTKEGPGKISKSRMSVYPVLPSNPGLLRLSQKELIASFSRGGGSEDVNSRMTDSSSDVGSLITMPLEASS